MGSPFDAQIAANPTAGTLHLPPAAVAADPRQTHLTPKTSAGDTAVVGYFTHALEEGLAVLYSAAYTISSANLNLANAQPDRLKLTVDGTAYNVGKIRKRYWGGVQVAWTLLLT